MTENDTVQEGETVATLGTIRVYWNQANIEREICCLYVHLKRCKRDCGKKCNGQKGFDLAKLMNEHKPMTTFDKTLKAGRQAWVKRLALKR